VANSMWLIRADHGGVRAADFIAGGYVAVGFNSVINAPSLPNVDAMAQQLRAAHPDFSSQQTMVRANQLWRFCRVVKPDDAVVTYDPATRRYHLGVIRGAVIWSPADDEDLPNRRAVDWHTVVARDSLSPATRNSLGAIQTIILVPRNAAAELAGAAIEETSGPIPNQPPLSAIALPLDGIDPFVDLDEQAVERIKDKIARLDWEEMQELVAALLRAMGYRTTVAPRGPDRGRDILATPDGFGFRPPRIFVEVKHRPGQTMGAPEVRAMRVGPLADDRGLFVSTGGFSREAYYEAEAGQRPISLMTLDGLTRAIIDAYPQFDDAGRALLPLRRLYWPVD
jgi:restriction system protein